MEEMPKSHFIEKYNHLLILIYSNDDDDYENPSKSEEDKIKNVFSRIKNKKSKNYEFDLSLENICIHNVRDLTKNKKESNKKNFDNFKIDNNHSDILKNSYKLSNNHEDISLDAREILNEINLTESAASTYREKIDRKLTSLIKPSNTFNRFENDLEYQLDLENAKRKNKRSCAG